MISVKRLLQAAPSLMCNRFAGSSIGAESVKHEPDKDVLEKATIHSSLLKPYVNEILKQDDPFHLNDLVKLEDLYKARVHYGHRASLNSFLIMLWLIQLVGTLHEKMKWALFGERLGVCIFDLSLTKLFLIRALNFLAHVSFRGGIILFVSSDRANMLQIEDMAKAVGEYSHLRKWVPGTLTNMKLYVKYPIRLPDTIVLLPTLTSVLETHPAVLEATKLAIPTIGVVDSNSDPSYITYVVPGNDDSSASILYFMDLFTKAIKRGKEARQEHIKKYGEIEEFPPAISR
uniref:28S ribosomal protein S2, mitochondrial n=1 Tax=Syphacia muris TaxID=451379 RepID=A0A0N5AJB8_9BILA